MQVHFYISYVDKCIRPIYYSLYLLTSKTLAIFFISIKRTFSVTYCRSSNLIISALGVFILLISIICSVGYFWSLFVSFFFFGI